MADTPEIVTKVAMLPGMLPGNVGVVGHELPGPNFRTVAIRPILFYGEKLLYVYLKCWCGIAGMNVLGWLVSASKYQELFTHVKQYLIQVSVLALGATVAALITMAYSYFKKRQIAMGQEE